MVSLRHRTFNTDCNVLAKPFVEVALPVPMRKTFDYLAPEGEPCLPGCRVQVPFGRRIMVGVVLTTKAESDWPVAQLKAAKAIDSKPLWPESIKTLLGWASQYYQHPLGEVFHHALPKKLRQGDAVDAANIEVWQITEQGKQQTAHTLGRARKQWQLLDMLTAGAQDKGSLSAAGFNKTTIQPLLDKGWIQPGQLADLKVPHTTLEAPPATPEQAIAITAMEQRLGHFSVTLLDGVTGSGKTRVYLDLMKQVIAQDQQVLVLVPEIGLTPQTLARFRQHLGVHIAVIHSGLNDSERLAAWQAARTGQVSVVLGTRSAVFTPLKNPGLIVIDEEHDTSYKQQDGFRYHGRDLAVVRAKQENIPLLLGSATPSLESLHNVNTQRYFHLTLKQRATGAPMPSMHVVDMRRQVLDGPLAEPLINTMRKHLEEGSQVLVFLNRRGFSPVLLCHECGWFAECERCNRPFTWHKQYNRMTCHHCNTERRIPHQCDSCGSTQLLPVGHGTERLQDVLEQEFEGYQVARIDRDSTRRKDAFEKLVQDIQAERYQILLGTQMLAKGHDFAKVSLVAMLDIDGALFSSDFRAGEKLSQLLTQVSGRAGRAGQPAQVVLQTHYPEHPWVQQLITQSYGEIAEELLKERQQAQLPPVSSLIMIRAEATQEGQVREFLIAVENVLNQHKPEAVLIMGASPCSMTRKAGKYRWQLPLLSANRRPLQQLMQLSLADIEALPLANKIRWHVDVDPQETT